ASASEIADDENINPIFHEKKIGGKRGRPSRKSVDWNSPARKHSYGTSLSIHTPVHESFETHNLREQGNIQLESPVLKGLPARYGIGAAAMHQAQAQAQQNQNMNNTLNDIT